MRGWIEDRRHDGDADGTTSERQNAYLARSAELNTQRWLSADEPDDLLAPERDAPGGP